MLGEVVGRREGGVDRRAADGEQDPDEGEDQARLPAVPIAGSNQRWQAETGFDFKIAGGYLSTAFPEEYTRYPTWNTLYTGELTPDYGAQLRRFILAKGVDAIVVRKRELGLGPWRKLFASLNSAPGHRWRAALPPPASDEMMFWQEVRDRFTPPAAQHRRNSQRSSKERPGRATIHKQGPTRTPPRTSL
jgi:hypothetical protein